MKKIIALLLVLSSICQAQQIPVQGTVNLSDYYRKSEVYSRSQIDSLLKNVGVKPPVIGVPNCDRGPSIEGISKISNTGLVLLFDAQGVPAINYDILNLSGDILYSDSLIRLTSNTVPVAFKPLADGPYYLRITGRYCKSAEPSQRKFTIKSETGTIPVPLPDCEKGPTPVSMTEVSTTSAKLLWDGSNVRGFDYSIYKGTERVSFNSVKEPPGNTIYISYAGLTPGQYVISLTGTTCKSPVSSLDFTVPGNPGGGVIPPPPGQVTAKLVTRGFPAHMDITFKGTGESRTFTDNADFSAPEGYEFRYYLNNYLVKTKTRLVEYPWPSDVPLTIYKFQIRPDVKNILSWGSDEGWKDPDAGRMFSPATTGAYAMYVFESSANGYNPETGNVQWTDYLPDAPATDDKIWVNGIGKFLTPDQLIRKGVTTFSNYAIDGLPHDQLIGLVNAGRTYNEAVKTPQQLNLPDRGSGQWVPPGVSWPGNWNTQFFDYRPGQTEPLTWQQGFDAGNWFSDAHRVNVFENYENVHAIGTQWGFWKPYYENLTRRLEARFPGKWRIAHNYFTGAIGSYQEMDRRAPRYGQSPATLYYISRQQAKNFLSAPLSEWPTSPMSPGQNLETVNSACYPIYLNSVDDFSRQAYNIIYHSYLTHKAGKYEFIFPQSIVEWNPNNYKEVVYPEGKFYYHEKLPHGFVDIYNYAFLSRVFADGWIPFGAGVKTDGIWKFDKQYQGGSGMWFPKGNKDAVDANSFPYWTEWNGKYNYPSNGFEDAAARGMYAYSQTFMKVSGGEPKFLRYRIDGGAWVDAQNKDLYDVVDAHHDKRAIVYSLSKNGITAVMYMNPYADGSKHKLEYELNGRIYEMSVASTMIQARLSQ